MAPLTALVAAISDLNDEYLFIGVAGIVSVAAFVGLILVPALGSFSRGWEKVAASVLSMFVLAALVLVGFAIGLFIFYNWDTISQDL